MSTLPCDGGCGRTVNERGGRRFCVVCTEKRANARKSERKREVQEALARGEAPPPPKQAPLIEKPCAACKTTFATYNARKAYCNKKCGENHRYATGARINAPRERAPRSGGIGPATPLIKTDWDGMLRRATLDAAAGVSAAALSERGIPERIIRKAMKAAGVDHQRRRNGDYSLLPFGPPV